MLTEAQAKLDTLAKGTEGGVAMAWVDADGFSFLSAGTFDPENPRPITPDTQFEVASIAKLFTAILLAKSERLGKVNRNDPVGKYLLPTDDPDAAKLAKITLLLLATHHSGLPREPSNVPPAVDSNCYAFGEYTREELINAMRIDGPGAPSDLVFAYSNFGASLLGQALSDAWRESYPQVLREQVLRSLGLDLTIVAMPGTTPSDDLAPGHANGKRINNWTFDAAAPALGLRSSVRELAKFLSSCLAGPDGPMHADLTETMKPLRKIDYGFVGMGWGITSDAERLTYSHSGGIGGYRSFLGFVPENHHGVVILANTIANIEALGCSLLGLTVPVPIPPVISNAGDYVGQYPLSPSFAIRVAEQNGALFFQATGQPGGWLKPLTVDRFILPTAPAEVSFQRDDTGKVVSLTWHHNCQKYVGFRSDLPPPPKEIVLSRAALAEYTGQYSMRTGLVITVRLMDTGLEAQATGQRAAAIFASAKDEFFYKVVEARITFIRKSTGKIAGLILDQDGRRFPAEKIP
ncbi:MAG TPA: serine hydrolase [Candidatus Acidoferrum sp.]|jgi:D-alanyl-D-alanine-carboxypeptidase/D-alanyl-D-alanine-endopeptidase|nr:serine hydrolase [Candidatus Acidoferrum sp.]